MSNGIGQTDKRINWNDIPDVTIIPAGKILFQITEIEELISGSGKLMYKHKLTAMEPPDVHGMIHFENFVIGTDEDPNADSPMTWKSSIGAKRMKNMYTKARVPFSESMYATMSAARGAMFVGKTVVKKDADPNSKYYGNEQTNITTCYMVGEAVPALEGGAVGAPVSGAPAPAPMNTPPPAMAAPPLPAPAPAPTPAAPPAAPVRKMTAKAQGSYEAYVKAGWTDQQLIDNGLMEMVSAAPPAPATSAPAAMPAPAAAPAPAMAPPVGAPALAPAVAAPTMAAPVAAPTQEACTACPMCQGAIPNSQFATHVATCATNRAAQAAAGLK